MIKGCENIKILRFNNLINFELPDNDINFIIGNNIDYKNDIIKALNIYFGNLKEDTKYIDYNKDTLKIYNNDVLINKKDYKIINLDFSNIDLNNEINLNKNSILREILISNLNNYYSNSDIPILINSIFDDLIDIIKDNSDIFNNDLIKNINIDISQNEFTVKDILDNMINIELSKDDDKIPIDFLSSYEQSKIIINLVEELIKLNNNEKNIILSVNNIDCLLVDNQIFELYNLIEKLAKKYQIKIYIFTNNFDILKCNNNLLKTIIINQNNSILNLEIYDEILNKVRLCYPKEIDNNILDKMLKISILKYFKYFGNFVQINDIKIGNLEELTIIKIVNDIFEFKYDLYLTKEYQNNCFYLYLNNFKEKCCL